jgi:hypothetical protein
MLLITGVILFSLYYLILGINNFIRLLVMVGAVFIPSILGGIYLFRHHPRNQNLTALLVAALASFVGFEGSFIVMLVDPRSKTQSLGYLFLVSGGFGAVVFLFLSGIIFVYAPLLRFINNKNR